MISSHSCFVESQGRSGCLWVEKTQIRDLPIDPIHHDSDDKGEHGSPVVKRLEVTISSLYYFFLWKNQAASKPCQRRVKFRMVPTDMGSEHAQEITNSSERQPPNNRRKDLSYLNSGAENGGKKRRLRQDVVEHERMGREPLRIKGAGLENNVPGEMPQLTARLQNQRGRVDRRPAGVRYLLHFK